MFPILSMKLWISWCNGSSTRLHVCTSQHVVYTCKLTGWTFGKTRPCSSEPVWNTCNIRQLHCFYDIHVFRLYIYIYICASWFILNTQGGHWIWQGDGNSFLYGLKSSFLIHFHTCLLHVVPRTLVFHGTGALSRWCALLAFLGARFVGCFGARFNAPIPTRLIQNHSSLLHPRNQNCSPKVLLFRGTYLYVFYQGRGCDGNSFSRMWGVIWPSKYKCPLNKEIVVPH